MDTELIVILLTLIFSAFFSGIEIAFVSSSRLKIEKDKIQGSFSAKILSSLISNPSRFIGSLLVGNNIALVVYGIYMAKILEPWIKQFTASDVSVALIQTLLSTLLVLVSAEFLPKTIFRINPNQTLNVFAVPVWIFYYLLYPIVLVTIGLSNAVLRFVLKIETEEDDPGFGRIDLDNYLKEATSQANDEEEIEHEVQIFRNALDFSGIKVRECMIPRTEIIAMDIETSLDELRENFTTTGLSKILIYRENVDNIIGFTHSSEMFKNPEAIKSTILPVTIVPETMSGNDALKHLMQQKKSIAVVVDEFGGTSGILTIEDMVEEIFGEIEDEHDHEDLIENEISKNSFLFSARQEIDYLNDKFKLGIPESDDYETLAGYVISKHESIPDLDEKIKIDNFLIDIKKVEDNRIDELVLTVIEEEE
jgi:putative hemolysin